METKKCDGIYGHHYCVEVGGYESNFLPLHEFAKDASRRDGLQHMCRWCKRENGRRRDYARQESITSLAMRRAGGRKALYALSRDERLQLRAKATKEVDACGIKKMATIPLAMWNVWMGETNGRIAGNSELLVKYLKRYQEEIPKLKEEALPKIYKKINRQPPKEQKLDYPPEGYVYIFRNRWHPENIYKIGSTDNLKKRRSAARTWGPYKCEYYLEVADCKKVEADVHERLSDYRIAADDLGEEHFKVDLTVAIKTIELAKSHDSLSRILDSSLAA